MRFEVLLKKLIDHISASIEVVVLGDETIKHISDEATRTNIWLIKSFRTMIENRWGMTIDERDDDGGEEQDEVPDLGAMGDSQEPEADPADGTSEDQGIETESPIEV